MQEIKLHLPNKLLKILKEMANATPEPVTVEQILEMMISSRVYSSNIIDEVEDDHEFMTWSNDLKLTCRRAVLSLIGGI